MIISVALLITLQVLWLKDSYEKAYFDFSRESDMIFRNTFFSLRDSLFIKNVKPVDGDSIEYGDALTNPDSFNIKFYSSDSLKIPSGVQVLITAEEKGDPDVNLLRPLASKIHHLGRQRSFVIRIGPDTINVDTLAMQYRKTLADAGILLPFKIKHTKLARPLKMTRRLGMFDERHELVKSHRQELYKDTLITDRMYFNPMHSYAAVFHHVRASILKEITPQILFSAFLSFITITSFAMIYGSLRAQQRLNNLKNDFLNNVTHELKTPVATVSVALEALKDFHALESPERAQAYLGMAQTELNRLTLMTDKILKTSVFENQGITFIPEKVNLHSVIQQVLSSMDLVFSKKNMRVSYTQEGDDFVLEGCEMHLTHVVYNLVDNALKYSDDNTSLELRLKNSGSSVEFSVRDYGIGIAKEYRKRIFEKFFRVPTGDVHNVKGYGLGLNYVASVVKKHGGRIDVQSELGKGSLFTIHLPIKRNKIN